MTTETDRPRTVLVVGSTGGIGQNRTTFELVAQRGEAPTDLEPLFGALGSDEPNSLDGVRDEDNMPLPDEPARVRDDLAAVTAAEKETS